MRFDGQIAVLCGFHFHELTCRRGSRNRLPVLPQAFDMKLDGLTNERRNLFLCLPVRDLSYASDRTPSAA